MLAPKITLILALTLLFPRVPSFAQSFSSTSFVLDGNRIYAKLSFVRPDGSPHLALAFVDMGSPATILTESLFKELQLDRNQALTFRVGRMLVRVPAAQVTSDPDPPYSVGSDLKVEAVLPASVLQSYMVVMDYQKRRLTLADPGALRPAGIPVPFRINHKTGLIAVDVSINGHTYPMTVDNGSAYTWLRQSTAVSWLSLHPAWQRGVGAVGPSNMMMAGNNWEASGLLLRIPQIAIGALRLSQVGALAAGPGVVSGNLDLFDWYSTKSPLPVLGWLGGNVLKNFRLTVDYPNHTLYWLRQAAPDAHDLDQVGLTLQAQGGDFVVAAVASQNGKPTVQNVEPGDQLLRIDRMHTRHASWGAIYAALHGRPGQLRTLLLQRNGRKLTVRAKVTRF